MGERIPMKTAILTDTNSGIFASEAKQLGIFSLPMPVIIDEKTYFEGKDLTESEFYEILSSERSVSTSQPAVGSVLEQWDRLLADGYDAIVYIPMSSELSSSCEVATILAEDYAGKVFVADNHRISVTLRHAVLQAKQMADEGMDPRSIKDRLEADAYRATIYISVNTLEFLKRSGRVTPAAAMLGTALGIKPILTIQGGKLDAFSKGMSMRRCEVKMIEAIQNDLQKRFPEAKTENVHIGAAGTLLSDKDREYWMGALREAFPGADVFYSPLSLSIGCHVGPGAIAAGACVN